VNLREVFAEATTGEDMRYEEVAGGAKKKQNPAKAC